jgi:large subunit ribosomal protein L20
MSRVKRGRVRTTKRRALLKQAKGYYGSRKNLVKHAKTAVKKAGQRAYDHRKLKKRDQAARFSIKINAGVRAYGMSYSKLMGALKKKNIMLDRKVLSQLAEHYPAVFEKLIAEVKK